MGEVASALRGRQGRRPHVGEPNRSLGGALPAAIGRGWVADPPSPLRLMRQEDRMHRSSRTLLVASACALTLIGCSAWEEQNRTTKGAVYGAGAGAAAGSAIGAIAGGG